MEPFSGLCLPRCFRTWLFRSRHNRRTVVELAGGREVPLVPLLNRDRGQQPDPRRVRGGRTSMHKIPCMVTVTATRHNLATRDFHTRLCCQGKPGQVAMIAAMCKLLLVLNAVLRDQVPWQPRSATIPHEA